MTNVLVHAAFGQSPTEPSPVWTDITRWTDIQAVALTVTRGASDELQQTQTGTLSLRLDNEHGLFTPGNTSSPFAPGIRKRTPIRYDVAVLDKPAGAGPTWPLAQLADSFDNDDQVDTTLWPGNFNGAVQDNGLARVPAAAGVTAGFASARTWMLTASWSTVRVVTVPSAAGATFAQCTFMVNSAVSGTRLGFLIDPVAGRIGWRNEVAFHDDTPMSVLYDPAVHAWLRVRESAGTVYWETSPDGATWTVRRSLTTPAWVADPVFIQMAATRDAGTTDYAEYDLLGATVHNRFYGAVASAPKVRKGLTPYMSVTASDIFAWLSRQPALQPMLVQEILADDPELYYPLSEADGSTSAGDLSGNTRAALALFQSGVGGTLQFGQATGPPTDGLSAPVFTPASSTAGLSLRADIGRPLTTEANPGSHFMECWFSTGTKGRVMLYVATLDPPAFESSIRVGLDATTGHLKIDISAGGNDSSSTAATPDLSDGGVHHVLYDEAGQKVYVDGVSYTISTPLLAALRIVQVGGFKATALWAGSISHVAVYVARSGVPAAAGLLPHYTAGTTAFAGEDADARVARLAGYAGITDVITAGTFSPVAGQGELGQTALTHIREIETTESGKLIADRGSPSLVFQGRTVRYNPMPSLTISYPDTETDDNASTDDDQKLCNIYLGGRPGGATIRVTDPASIALYGPYERPVTLFKMTDGEVHDAAEWTVIRYADPPPEMRTLKVEAFTLPAALYRALLDADVSTVITVTDLPDDEEAPVTTIVVEGYTETTTQNQHVLDFHTSRADTDSVWVLDDPVYSVLGSTTRLAY